MPRPVSDAEPVSSELQASAAVREPGATGPSDSGQVPDAVESNRPIGFAYGFLLGLIASPPLTKFYTLAGYDHGYCGGLAGLACIVYFGVGFSLFCGFVGSLVWRKGGSHVVAQALFSIAVLSYFFEPVSQETPGSLPPPAVSVSQMIEAKECSDVLANDFDDPIYTDTEAICRSLELFPRRHLPHRAVARLLRTDHFLTLELGGVPSDMPQTAPVWVVAIVSERPSSGSALPDLVPDGSAATTAVFDAPDDIGSEYVWDANSGLVVAVFGIQEESEFQALSAVESEAINVAPATALPTLTTEATVTPVPAK